MKNIIKNLYKYILIIGGIVTIISWVYVAVMSWMMLFTMKAIITGTTIVMLLYCPVAITFILFLLSQILEWMFSIFFDV